MKKLCLKSENYDLCESVKLWSFHSEYFLFLSPLLFFCQILIFVKYLRHFA